MPFAVTESWQRHTECACYVHEDTPSHRDLDPETSPHFTRMLSRKNLGFVRDFTRKKWPRCGSGSMNVATLARAWAESP